MLHAAFQSSLHSSLQDCEQTITLHCGNYRCIVANVTIKVYYGTNMKTQTFKTVDHPTFKAHNISDAPSASSILCSTCESAEPMQADHLERVTLNPWMLK
jgi:hypothetical protein